MSKPDFDFSKYFEVPDKWIESALSIPNVVNTQPKVLPIRRYVAAASIVLVVALGISVFFRFGNKKPIPVKPDNSGIAVQSASESVTASDIGGAESTQPPSDAKTQPATGSRKDRSTIPTHSIQPTQAVVSTLPQAAESSSAPTYVSPAAEPPQSEPTDATQYQPTQKPVTPTPPSPTQPKAAPTSSPATQQPISTNTEPTEMDPPTELPWIIETPTEAGYEAEDALVLKAELTNRIRLNEKYVYCRIHKSTGELIGDKDLYAWQHRVTVNRNYKIVTYKPSERNLYLAPGNYVYYFYESNGDIFADGSFTIN